MSRTRFRLDGGRPSLDLVATLGKRHAEPVERIPDGETALVWLIAAGVLPAGVAVTTTATQLERLRELREVVNRLVRAAMASQPLTAADVAALNTEAQRPDLTPVLRAPGVGGLAWRGSPIDGALATIARDAIDLLVHGPIDRIRECAGANCSLLFYDDSQAGRRQWCSMSTCGSQAKVRAYRARTRRVASQHG